MSVCLVQNRLSMSASHTDGLNLVQPFLPQADLGGVISQLSDVLTESSALDVGLKHKSMKGPFLASTDDRHHSATPQPALSCQALKHAVSALSCIDDFFLEEIGSGFYATVNKAIHKVTGQEMVMKINKDYSNRSSALREIQLMNKMSHPNILRFLGVCVHEGQLHALTEYISGGTLETLLEDKSQELPWMCRIKLALDIAQGMHYLHSEGVFHRDLTSRNVLIKKGENRNYQAVIADFGLATKIPDPGAKEPLPPVGCPWWMAPEVINNQFYDQRADLFSYGIILLEITARIVADPETMPRTKNFGVDYIKLVEMVDYCPLDFLQLAFKCCQIVPERRPCSAVVKITLERIYRNLHNELTASPEKLRKRSKSEDNIIQSSDSFSDFQGQEIFMTPQIVAQAMTKDDPDYCPAGANPFADISRLRDGKKVHELPGQRKFSIHNSGLSSSGKSVDLTMSESRGETRPSLSLPSSPIMLRKAAEKLHLASLHGSEAVQADGGHDLRGSLSSESQKDSESSALLERRAQFCSNRTRSLGSLDFWHPRFGPGALSRARSGNQSGDNQSTARLDSDGYVISRWEGSTNCLEDDETFQSELESNFNCVGSRSLYNEAVQTSNSESDFHVDRDDGYDQIIQSEVDLLEFDLNMNCQLTTNKEISPDCLSAPSVSCRDKSLNSRNNIVKTNPSVCLLQRMEPQVKFFK